MTMTQSANYRLINTERDNERPFETREEAESEREKLIGIGEDPDVLEIVEIDDDGKDMDEQAKADAEEQLKEEAADAHDLPTDDVDVEWDDNVGTAVYNPHATQEADVQCPVCGQPYQYYRKDKPGDKRVSRADATECRELLEENSMHEKTWKVFVHV